MHGIPYLLLALGRHGVLANTGLNHEAGHRSLGRSAKHSRALHPPPRLDAEDREVDGVAVGRHNAVLGDHAVLLAAGYDLAGQQQQRLLRVVDQHQRVYLVADEMLAPRAGVAAAMPHQSAHLTGFGHLYGAIFETVVESEKGRARRGPSAGADHREQEQIAALDGSEHMI
jgi:hypothetical protein